MPIDLKSKTTRSQLDPRREPYWQRISTGFYVGYRVLETGAGTWIARIRSDEGKQKYQALGTHDSLDDAIKAANLWRDQLSAGVGRTDTTVEEACRAYASYLKTKKGSSSFKDAEGRFKRLVYGAKFGAIQLAKLKTTDVRKWVEEQLAIDDDGDEEDLRRSKDSANRNLASLKAALNHALKDRLVATDAGWKTVTPFRGVGRRREHMLTHAERSALIKACPADLAELVKGLLLTGARPGELAKATVGDFDKRQGTIVLNGKTGRRVAPVSSAAKAFFLEHAKGKLPGAYLMTDGFGNQWNKDDWKKPFKAAVRKAGLPENIVMYHLRHAAISEMILAGVQSSIVALLTGTSTTMIDQHYGHLQHEKTRALLDKVSLL